MDTYTIAVMFGSMIGVGILGFTHWDDVSVSQFRDYLLELLDSKKRARARRMAINARRKDLDRQKNVSGSVWNLLSKNVPCKQDIGLDFVRWTGQDGQTMWMKMFLPDDYNDGHRIVITRVEVPGQNLGTIVGKIRFDFTSSPYVEVVIPGFGKPLVDRDEFRLNLIEWFNLIVSR